MNMVIFGQYKLSIQKHPRSSRAYYGREHSPNGKPAGTVGIAAAGLGTGDGDILHLRPLGCAVQLCNRKILEPRFAYGKAAISAKAQANRHAFHIPVGFAYQFCPCPVICFVHWLGRSKCINYRYICAAAVFHHQRLYLTADAIIAVGFHCNFFAETHVIILIVDYVQASFSVLLNGLYVVLSAFIIPCLGIPSCGYAIGICIGKVCVFYMYRLIGKSRPHRRGNNYQSKYCCKKFTHSTSEIGFIGLFYHISPPATPRIIKFTSQRRCGYSSQFRFSGPSPPHQSGRTCPPCGFPQYSRALPV